MTEGRQHFATAEGSPEDGLGVSGSQMVPSEEALI